ncbi:hypothetical protein CTI12_AA244880 [Artemisia annua]|uniref:RNA-directed DNA polymerase, eukaryota, Reverse transcriptase zinc-binding domain protein n=1 Tax=Artemisia annua TaxID=35608 RepID=A0A2U1NNZ0_ARTAN|nr:hypothetical protein CTI12_AA244880 [Artemisia annua]
MLQSLLTVTNLPCTTFKLNFEIGMSKYAGIWVLTAIPYQNHYTGYPMGTGLHSPRRELRNGLYVTKSVLSSIPLFYFSLFKVPIGVLKRLESCRSNFFRGVEEGSRKVSWFFWDSVVASKEVGGLGMSSFLAMNCALLFKWIWRFKVQHDAMWVSIIKAIHGRSGRLDCGVQVDTKNPILANLFLILAKKGLPRRILATKIAYSQRR